MRPVTVQLVVEEVQVKPPGEEVTVYKVMGDPPLELGAVQVTFAEVAEATTALTLVGAPGAAAGVIELEGGEAGEVPIALVAVKVKV